MDATILPQAAAAAPPAFPRVLARTPCPLCGGGEGHRIAERDRRGAPLVTLLCSGCGLVRSDPLPDPEGERRWYEAAYRERYKGDARPRRRHCVRETLAAIRRLPRVRPLLREDSRVLDVGCGGGFFPYVLAWLGIRCEGIEPDRGHARFAREALRLEGVRAGALEELAPERRWTLITLHHVLEHLPDPAAALARLRALLPADGALLLEVPTLADRRRPWWRQFHRAHLCWWDERTLEALARRSGFRCESLVLEPLTGHLSALLRPAAPEPLAATRLGAHAAARLAALATAPAPAPGLRLRLGLRRLARRAGETALALLPLSRGRLCALLCRLCLGPRRGAAPS